MTADFLLKQQIAAEDAPRRKTLKDAYVIERIVPNGRTVWWDGVPVACYDNAPATVYAETQEGERYAYPMQFLNPANAYVIAKAVKAVGSIDPNNWTPAPLAG